MRVRVTGVKDVPKYLVPPLKCRERILNNIVSSTPYDIHWPTNPVLTNNRW